MSERATSQALAVDLTAVVVAVTEDEPRVLVVRGGTGARAAVDRLPSGPLERHHRTLENGLRAWVEELTHLQLGYVEQLYTFGDRDRQADRRAGAAFAAPSLSKGGRQPTAAGAAFAAPSLSKGGRQPTAAGAAFAAPSLSKGGRRPTAAGARVLSVGYLALVREARAAARGHGSWQNWYRYFPWEDWRAGEPAILHRIGRMLRRWAASASTPPERRARSERLSVTFGLAGAGWNHERVLERYELLYEVGLVPEAHRDGMPRWAGAGDLLGEAEPMQADHRRILATAIARLRGKIKYRPVVFELMAPSFTLLQLQRTVEALAGLRIHKQNFRRLVEQQGLVEETGGVVTGTGGRPARKVRFRPEVTRERLAPGVRLPIVRQPA